jgi:hypothetical protein
MLHEYLLNNESRITGAIMVCWRYRTIVFEFKKNGLLGDRFIDDEEVESTLNEQGVSVGNWSVRPWFRMVCLHC